MNRDALFRAEPQMNCDINALVDAFDRDREHGVVDLTDYLPPNDHPLFNEILVELIRVDIERFWQAEQPPRISDYRERFPDTLADPAVFAPIAFEEYRLRHASGQECTPDEYHEAYGTPIDQWPDLPAIGADFGSAGTKEDPSRLPHIGDKFLGFDLIGELGSGAFARVFLARQGDLASRFVALKVSSCSSQEPQRLAQLQHTNIVPIYSVHRQGELQAVCMPFLGPNTLADVLKGIHAQQELPTTGSELVSTLMARQASSIVQKQLSTTNSEPATEEAPPKELFGQLRQFDQMSYVAVAAWIVVRIAEGLAHAHDHGIVHRDLKPANILLSDDGEPLILDFNLSTDPAEFGESTVGGTVPYMAPEQIRALRDGSNVGPGADIYSLGVILFELLTGRLPYPLRRGITRDALEKLLADRRVDPVNVRSINPAVSTDLASIVTKALERQPQQRYQHSHELQEDLQLHLANRPLRYAPNRSTLERVRKWRRRHPRLVSTGSVASVCFAVIIGLVYAWHFRGLEVNQREAQLKAMEFMTRVEQARTVLGVPSIDDATLRRGIAGAEDAAEMYQLNRADELSQQELFPFLGEAMRARLDAHASELLFLLACGKSTLAHRNTNESIERETRTTAMRLNRLAQSLSREEVPVAIRAQRARLLAVGSQETTDSPRPVAFELDMSRGESPRGHSAYLLAVEQMQRHLPQEAEKLLRIALKDRPQSFSYWFGLGSSLLAQGQLQKAANCYTACVALQPKALFAYHMRGVCKLSQGRFDEALTDFDEVLLLDPKFPEAWINRGLALQKLGKHQDAVNAFTKALGTGASQTRIYFVRAQSYHHLGNSQAAANDRREGMSRAPLDELSWIARGLANADDNPIAALSDFESALEMNPLSVAAMQNSAFILSEKLGRAEDAVKVMDHLVATRPLDADAWASRGVLLARLNRRNAALADVSSATEISEAPMVLYRSACVCALLSGETPSLRPRAIQFVRRALAARPQLAAIAMSDSDLAALHEDPRFLRVAAAADVLINAN